MGRPLPWAKTPSLRLRLRRRRRRRVPICPQGKSADRHRSAVASHSKMCYNRHNVIDPKER